MEETVLASVTSTTYSAIELTPNTSYTFAVKAKDVDGNVSLASNSLHATTLLATPTNLVTTTSSSITIDLSWDDIVGATGYEVYRDDIKIGTSDINSYTDSGLSPEKTYVYTIKAYNADGNVSAFSNLLTVSRTKLAPIIPINIKVETTDKTLTVSWNPVEGADSYDVLLDDNITNVTEPNYTYNSLEPNTQHIVKVRAVNQGGNSEWSSEIVKYTLLATPINLVANPEFTSINLTWDAVVGATGYEVYRDDIKIGTSDTNSYSDTGLIAGKTYLYKIKTYNETGNESAFSNPLTVSTIATTYISSSLTLTEDKVYGDVYLTGGTLDLAGHKMTVKGKLIQSGGNLKINGGQLKIAGDYRIQTETKQSDGSATYTYSKGSLYMANSADYIYVGGSFVTEAYYGGSNYLTAGILEVAGDFIQKYGDNSSNNFCAYGTHKVILSGNTVQTVSFENPGSSRFNIFEISDSACGINFNTAVSINTLIGADKIKTSLDLVYTNTKLANNYIINGNLTLRGGSLDLAGKTITVENDLILAGSTLDINSGSIIVKGKLIQSEGKLKINGGRLIISGDYRIQTENKQSDGSVTYTRSNAILYMNNTADYIYVGGSFVTEAYYGSGDYLTAGVMEVAGDFIQKYGDNSSNNFCAYGTHKVILSGNTVQTVSFENPGSSRFNIFEISDSACGINFNTAVSINTLIGADKIKTSIDLVYTNTKLTNNYTIKGNLTLQGGSLDLAGKTITVENDLILAGGTLDINSGSIIVKGKLIQSGGELKINGGQLKIAGDYRIQTETKQSDGSATYTRSLGSLYMTNTAVYIYVGGSFVIQSRYKNYLTAGVMEVAGDFIQKYESGYSISSYNFCASGTHKVILSGTTVQTVSFDNPGSSRFNILITTKPFDYGYSFNSSKVWNVIIEDYRYPQYFGQNGMNSATGNFSRTYTDLTMDAPGYAIAFSRTYNSRNNSTSVFGRGWTFSYEGSIRDSQTSINNKEVRLPDGSVLNFKRNSDGTFTGYDSHTTLVMLVDGTYVFTTKEQSMFYFNTNGDLIKIQDKNGNAITINVDSDGKVLGVTDQAGRHFTITYENGLIKTIKDDTGNRTVTYYYENNCLTKATDAMENSTSYTYDSDGFITEIRDSNDKLIESITYIHSGENKDKVNNRTDIDGNVFNYTYDNINCNTIITDSNGRITTEKYDSSFNIINSTYPEGQSTAYVYNNDANGINKYSEEISTTDLNGNITKYQRDNNGNITQITNPDSSTKVMAYDDKNNLISVKDEMGKYTFYVYDANQRNLIKQVQPLNGTDQYIDGTSDVNNFAITTYTYYTDAECQANGYNAKDLLKSETDSEGNTTTYTYDIYGNVKTETDANNNTNTYKYNAMGQLIESTTAKGNKTYYFYDKNGNLEKQVTDGGETTRFTYNSDNNIIKEVSPKQYDPTMDDLANHKYNGDQGTRYTYYDNGKLKTVTDANNYKTSYTYDIYGSLQTETKPNGSIYTYEYDLLNRPVKVFFKGNSTAESVLLEEYSYAILSDGKTQNTVKQYLNDTEVAVTVSTYDYAGRLISQKNPDGTTTSTTYNPNGTVNYTIDAKGNKTYYTYDGLNRISEQWTPFKIENGITRFTYLKTEYDKAGKKVAEITGKDTVTQNGIPTQLITKTYEYYENGLLKAFTDNEGRRTEYLYDADGNVSQETIYTDATNKNITEYIYNNLGKISQKNVHVKAGDLEGNDFNSTEDIILTTTYTYDKNGNLETVTTPDNVTTTYTYDNMNNQTSVSQPGVDENGEPVKISSSTQYDWQGNVTSTTDANGNVTIYKYNQRGLLETVTDAAVKTTAFYYDRAGRKIAEVAAKDYASSKTLDQMNRVEYTYDLMGRLKTKIYIGEEKKLDQVTHEWTTQQVIIVQKAYKYDNNGNVIKELDVLGYEAATTKTSVDTQISTGYGTEYTYNLANQLVTVLDPESKSRSLSFTTKYSYDALGRKTSETNAKGVTTKYYYDDEGNVTSVTVRETSTAPEQVIKTATYDNVGNMLTQTDANGSTTTFEYNALGTVRKAIYPGDASIPQNTVTYQYDVMGRLKTQQDTKGAVDTYTYSNQGAVLTHTQKKQDNTDIITNTYRYDKNGNARYVTDEMEM